MSIFPVADRVIVEVYAFSCATLEVLGEPLYYGQTQSVFYVHHDSGGIVDFFLVVMDSYKGHLNRKFRI